jgi:hypothetical protein
MSGALLRGKGIRRVAPASATAACARVGESPWGRQVAIKKACASGLFYFSDRKEPTVWLFDQESANIFAQKGCACLCQFFSAMIRGFRRAACKPLGNLRGKARFACFRKFSPWGCQEIKSRYANTPIGFFIFLTEKSQ